MAKVKIPSVFKDIFPFWFKGPERSKIMQKPGSDDRPISGEVLFTSQRQMWEFFETMTKTGKSKKEKIVDYEIMVKDPVVMAALEQVAEDSFQIDDQNRTIMVVSKDKKVLKNTVEFLDAFNIEESISDWAFQNPYYGEVPIRIYGEIDRGIVSLTDDIHPLDFYRIQSGSLFGFMSMYDHDERNNLRVLAPWEMVHMFYKRDISKKRFENVLTVDIGKKKVILDAFEVMGYLESIRTTFKKLKLVEDSMVMARLDRAPLKRVFYIDVGDADPKQKIEIISEFKKNYKESVSFTEDGYYKSDKNPMSFGQELFIPISEGIKNIEVSDYGGDVEVKAIVDVEYLKSKFMAGLKIPPAFLGMTEDLPGSIGESALVRMEIRYARTVKQNRRGVMNAVFRLAQIHNAYLGVEVTRENLQLVANYISTAEEEELRVIFNDRVESASSFIDILGDIGISIDSSNKKFIEYIIFELLKMTKFDIKILMESATSDEGVKEELKRYVSESTLKIRGDEVYETPLKKEEWIQRYTEEMGESPIMENGSEDRKHYRVDRKNRRVSENKGEGKK